MKLNLERPLIFFDLETTGLNIGKDRIVEISMLKIMPDGEELEKTMLLNPEIHIPEEASKVHGIYDKDVADKPRLEDAVGEISAFFGDGDIAGYNSNKFDVPFLVQEMARCGVNFDLRNRRMIDVQNIFHKMEPRTLIAAYKFYCGKSLDDAHQAAADTRATYEVLKGQLDMYKDTEYTDPKTEKVTKPVQNDVKMLSDFTKDIHNHVDLAGHIALQTVKGKECEVFNFGKHKGKPVKEVFTIEPQYYDWMMKADFPFNTKEVITRIRKEMMLEKQFGRS
ncbi:MAG: 3'-5' exonuclease [Bacteroidales bacterium]|nr:3'-5' exonuclease [Bacteroidales bacterium]